MRPPRARSGLAPSCLGELVERTARSGQGLVASLLIVIARLPGEPTGSSCPSCFGPHTCCPHCWGPIQRRILILVDRME